MNFRSTFFNIVMMIMVNDDDDNDGVDEVDDGFNEVETELKPFPLRLCTNNSHLHRFPPQRRLRRTSTVNIIINVIKIRVMIIDHGAQN